MLSTTQKISEHQTLRTAGPPPAADAEDKKKILGEFFLQVRVAAFFEAGVNLLSLRQVAEQVGCACWELCCWSMSFTMSNSSSQLPGQNFGKVLAPIWPSLRAQPSPSVKLQQRLACSGDEYHWVQASTCHKPHNILLMAVMSCVHILVLKAALSAAQGARKVICLIYLFGK